MLKLKFFLRNINLLNISLLIFVLLMANYMLFPFFDIKVKFTPSALKKTPAPEGEDTTQERIPLPSDYMIIAEQNLFHPERKIPTEKKEEQPLPKPEIVLYGTLITENLGLAYLEDKKSPRTTPGRGKRQIVLRKGDTLGGFTLKEIETDKIVMVKGEETIVVKVIDPTVKKVRETSLATPQPSSSFGKVQRSPASTRRTPTPLPQP